jgi:uncharacterized damage-inducible protein DinB
MEWPGSVTRSRAIFVYGGRMLDVLLDSWDRNNRILVNLLGAIPEDAMNARATPDSPSVAQMFAHLHYVRLVFIAEDMPESAVELPREEWATEYGRPRLAEMLNDSARLVRTAVAARIAAARAMDVHYDHPVLFLQHMIWHEGYHHGQIKLALKLAGRPIANAVAGPLTWRVWMNKS